MQSPIGATALLEPIPRKPISPKARAARFAARAFRPLLRFPTQTVRKPQAVVTLATTESPRECEKRRAASDPLVLLKRDLSLASVRAISACRRHVPGPAFPVACSGVRIWRAEP